MPERYGFNIWTKHKPKDYIKLFIEYAHQRNSPLIAVVDDMLTEVVFHRSKQETADFNGSYREYMTREGVDEMVFVSELFSGEFDDNLSGIIDVCNQISLSVFLAALPQHKIEQMNGLKLGEIIETAWQIQVLRISTRQKAISKWLTGRRSTAFFRISKNLFGAGGFEIID